MEQNKKGQAVSIRMATIEDAAAFLAIYEYYVQTTAITFEYETPSEEEFRERIRNTLRKYPYIVACREGEVVGYAYASAFKQRAAYGWSVETSIYVQKDAHGQGIGKLLYEVLENILKLQNVLNANACIAYPNPESIAFHEYFGYKKVAHFTRCGYKQGQWWDMIWMEKLLGEHLPEPKEVMAVRELELPIDLMALRNSD